MLASANSVILRCNIRTLGIDGCPKYCFKRSEILVVYGEMGHHLSNVEEKNWILEQTAIHDVWKKSWLRTSPVGSRPVVHGVQERMGKFTCVDPNIGLCSPIYLELRDIKGLWDSSTFFLPLMRWIFCDVSHDSPTLLLIGDINVTLFVSNIPRIRFMEVLCRIVDEL